jgi:predicted RNA-binding protein with PIN domain
MSKGAVRVSATEFYEEVKMQSKAITESLEQIKPVKNNMLIDNLDKETAAFLEQLRRMK